MQLARSLHYLLHPPDGPAGKEKREIIMAHLNVESFKSYAIAAVASLYCSVMFLAVAGQNGAQVGSLVI
ncbi:MAG: hypothetical protein C0429_16690 [Sphingopyxis sp.]|jgi:hypothetical protein|nr:hypothetical protein [Sphingopyxis sp.]